MADYIICDVKTDKQVKLANLSKKQQKVLLNDLTKIKEMLEYYIETGNFPAVGLKKFKIKILFDDHEDEGLTKFVAQELITKLEADIRLWGERL